MPALLFYRERERIPALEWMDDPPRIVRGKCAARLERLRDLGHELRRPEADFLRDGI